MNTDLWTNLAGRAAFIFEMIGIAVLLVIIAYVAEKMIQKRKQEKERILNTRKIAMVGVFSAIAAVVHLFDFSLFFFPEFYKLDFSEIPALTGAFAFGPVAGVMIEFCKVLLKLLMKGTSTAFVGDFANFVVGCSFVLPATIWYQTHKNKHSAIMGLVLGTLVMTTLGTAFNAVYLLPKFAQLFELPLDQIIAMGASIHPSVQNVATFVVLCVAPLNLVKGFVVSLLTMLLYKKVARPLFGKEQ